MYKRQSVAYSPDGKSIVSGSRDETIKIWDAKSGQLLSTLIGHKDSVFSVAYSPDGKSIISGSWDKTIKIWDVKSGKLLSTLIGHEDGVYSVAYSPNGKSIVSSSRDDTIKIWDVKKDIDQEIKELEYLLQAKLDGVTLKSKTIKREKALWSK